MNGVAMVKQQKKIVSKDCSELWYMRKKKCWKTCTRWSTVSYLTV